MAQTIRALAAKPNPPEFNPKTRCVGKKESIPVSCFLTHVHVYWNMQTCEHEHAHTQETKTLKKWYPSNMEKWIQEDQDQVGPSLNLFLKSSRAVVV